MEDYEISVCKMVCLIIVLVFVCIAALGGICHYVTYNYPIPKIIKIEGGGNLNINLKDITEGEI